MITWQAPGMLPGPNLLAALGIRFVRLWFGGERARTTVGFQPILVKLAENSVEVGEVLGLAKIAVCTQIVSSIDVDLLIRRGENDRDEPWRLRRLSNPIQNIETIEARHFEVKEDEPGQRVNRSVAETPFTPKIIDSLLPILDEVRVDSKSGFRKSTAKNDCVKLVVLNDKHDGVVGTLAAPVVKRASEARPKVTCRPDHFHRLSDLVPIRATGLNYLPLSTQITLNSQLPLGTPDALIHPGRQARRTLTSV